MYFLRVSIAMGENGPVADLETESTEFFIKGTGKAESYEMQRYRHGAYQ